MDIITIKNKKTGEILILREGSYDTGSHYIEPLSAYDKKYWEGIRAELEEMKHI